MNASTTEREAEAAGLLERVADAYGIEAGFHDIWGGWHSVSDASRRALLAAMGVEAGSEAGLACALERLEQSACRRLLPPVKVVREGGEAVEVVVSTLSAEAAALFEWELVLEGGSRYAGRFRPSELHLQGAADSGAQGYERRSLALAVHCPPGYHTLELRRAEAGGAHDGVRMSLIVAPQYSYRPAALDGDARLWGFAVQLYALRTARSQGIGDFGDLPTLIDFCADQGADVIALNPLHALFPSDPEDASPYGPSSRVFLNVLYVNVADAVREYRLPHQDAMEERFAALDAGELIDYAGVAAARLAALEEAWVHFREHELACGSDRASAFLAFRAERGEALELHALHDALQADFHSADPALWGWPVWPPDYRDPGSEAVQAFRSTYAERVDFHVWLQWLAHCQLAQAGRRALERGLGVGLMFDLAVGANLGGSAVWARQDVHASGAEVGSPPDDFNLDGQGWGCVPMNPHRLRDEAYEPFIELVRAAMREAGALRIDHVMGLQRLFWIPRGARPVEGAYVRYPFEDLLGIVALESVRNQCMVVGEDLGTVPAHFRAQTAERGLLGYRLLYFEREHDGRFRPPAHYPREVLAMTGTHDLPTLAGFWLGRDLEWRDALGLLGHLRSREEWFEARAHDRDRLLDALLEAGLLDQSVAQAQRAAPRLGTACAAATQRFLARSPAALMLVEAEDLLDSPEQVNLPGTSRAQHPNWRRRLPLELGQWGCDAHARAVIEAVRLERGRAICRLPAE